MSDTSTRLEQVSRHLESAQKVLDDVNRVVRVATTFSPPWSTRPHGRNLSSRSRRPRRGCRGLRHHADSPLIEDGMPSLSSESRANR